MAAGTIPIYFYVANRARSYNRERAIGNSVANGNDSRRSLIVILFSIVADKLSAISSRRTQLGGRFGRRAFREKRSLLSRPTLFLPFSPLRREDPNFYLSHREERKLPACMCIVKRHDDVDQEI